MDSITFLPKRPDYILSPQYADTGPVNVIYCIRLLDLQL